MFPPKILNVLETTKRKVPLRIPPGPLRKRPWKPLWNCSNLSFPQKKQNTEAVHLRLPTNKPILNQREVTVQRDPPSRASQHSGRNSCLLLRPSNFSARSSSSLYFWSSRYSWGRAQKNKIYGFELKPLTSSQDSAFAIKEESSPNSNYTNLIFLSKTSNSQS